MRYIVLTASWMIVLACNSQEQNRDSPSTDMLLREQAEAQIGEYVTSVYQDSKGNLWFGTLSRGMAKYDGTQLSYLTMDDGLATNRVTSVTENTDGTYWFHTSSGSIKYDGQTFTPYRVDGDDELSNMMSQFFIDSHGKIWVGTWGGVYKFDGSSFTPFTLPTPEVSTAINPDTKDWITDIAEDQAGNMYFGRDGYGVCRYDGKSFSHILKRDGLHSNNITEIEIAPSGDIWFATRVAERDHPNPAARHGSGGVNLLTKDGIQSFPEIESLNTGDVHEIYLDPTGDVWISAARDGVYQYTDGVFKRHEIPISIMSMLRDRSGVLWLAGAGGLYKIDEMGRVINVRVDGPWE